ncbi:MAG: Methyltransferase small domain [uncultured Acidilobus sp. MG]|jgi:Methylase of polypeptide chain release factors|nr:MAG: Methyltransferase small domain [uncultured Acidilobus sp. MG]
MACRESWREVLTSRGLVRFACDPCVYEPSDDTWIAVEALERLEALGYRFETVLDLGSGTGVLAAVARALFNPSLVAAVDLSPYAARATRLTLGPDALVAQCNGGRCLRGRWDLVILNPPYLPAGANEVKACEGLLDMAWSEETGHEILCRAAGDLGSWVVIVRSSLSALDVDSCLTSMGFSKVATLSNRAFMFERIWAELWRRAA